MKSIVFLLALLAIQGCVRVVSTNSSAVDRRLISQEAKVLSSAIEAAKSAGIVLGPAHFERHVPRDENALPVYEDAFSELSGLKLDPTGPSRPSGEKLYATKSAPAILLIDQAASKPLYDSSVQFEKGVFAGPSFVDYARLKYLAKILGTNALISAKSGDFSRMDHDYRDIGVMVGLAAQDRTVISDMVAIALGQIGFKSIEKAASIVGKNRDALGALVDALESYPATVDFAQAANGECLLMDQTLKKLGAPQYDQKTVVSAFRARGIEFWTQIMRIIRDPRQSYAGREEAFRAEVQKEQSGDISYFFVKYLGETVYGQGYSVCVRYAATRAVTAAGLALLESCAPAGEWPEALIPGSPPDPFTGKSLVYRRYVRSFAIYSVGPNLKDDGGAHKPRGDDIVFRYPSD